MCSDYVYETCFVKEHSNCQDIGDWISSYQHSTCSCYQQWQGYCDSSEIEVCISCELNNSGSTVMDLLPQLLSRAKSVNCCDMDAFV